MLNKIKTFLNKKCIKIYYRKNYRGSFGISIDYFQGHLSIKIFGLNIEVYFNKSYYDFYKVVSSYSYKVDDIRDVGTYELAYFFYSDEVLEAFKSYNDKHNIIEKDSDWEEISQLFILGTDWKIIDEKDFDTTSLTCQVTYNINIKYFNDLTLKEKIEKNIEKNKITEDHYREEYKKIRWWEKIFTDKNNIDTHIKGLK